MSIIEYFSYNGGLALGKELLGPPFFLKIISFVISFQIYNFKKIDILKKNSLWPNLKK